MNRDICFIYDFSSDLQRFYIGMDSISSTLKKNGSITCTSEENQKTITDEFTIKFDYEEALACDGRTDPKAESITQMIMGRGPSTYDLDYFVGDGVETNIGFYINQAKAGCGVDCAIEEPKFTVKSNKRSWKDAIKLQTYLSHQRLTFNVQAEGEVSVGLGQTEDCSHNSCFELAIGTGMNNDQLCLRPREDFDGENAESLCTTATGIPFFNSSGDKAKTYSVEWDLDTSSESNQLVVSVLDHDSMSSVDAKWEVDSATSTVEFVSFNAKRNDATFHIWVDFYPDRLFTGSGEINFAEEYAGEQITTAVVGIESPSNAADVTVSVGDIEIKFDSREISKKACVIDWSTDMLVVSDLETKEIFMEAELKDAKIGHISVAGKRNIFSVWVGASAPDKHTTHNRPAWI
jgi:hypothetical protein